MKQKKYAQIGVILILSFSIYLLLKRNPNQAKKILLHANNYIKYMPINKSTVDTFSNIFDFTNDINDNNNNRTPGTFMNSVNSAASVAANETTKVKRSVSETKKKYVASTQNWKCGNCGKTLNAWYEIDHKQRLEHGGSNEVDNLVALCRECHGEKTAMENM
jgi:5-methylcytosine-specific restriction endonuclease McrA